MPDAYAAQVVRGVGLAQARDSDDLAHRQGSRAQGFKDSQPRGVGQPPKELGATRYGQNLRSWLCQEFGYTRHISA